LVQPASNRLLVESLVGAPSGVAPLDSDTRVADENLPLRLQDEDLTKKIDGRVAKQVVKCVRLESGKWVWDVATGTHYVIPDHTGALVVRATAQPVPASTPALNW
jgi:hypothetical protein